MNLVVTGSSTGIGRAFVERRLAAGDRIWGMARSDQSAFASQCGGQLQTSVCDVARWSDVRDAANEVAATWSHVDAVVTCAGIQGEVGRAVTADPVRWSETVRANLDGTYYAIRAFHDLLTRSAQRRKIVCFSGGGATKARPNFSAYGVAKTGVVRLVEMIAEEEGASALDINAVAPGAVTTRLTEEVLALGPEIAGAQEYESAVKQKSTGGKSMARALDLVDWLLSSASDGISGRLLSAPWDPWPTLGTHAAVLASGDIYTLRRVIPEDRGTNFG